MAIDRIGKGTVPPPAMPSTGPAERAQGADASRPFEVRGEKTGEAANTAQVAAAGLSPLEQLRAGQIDMAGYVDLKVEQATAHLRGLSPEELGSIKSILRDQMATDPALVDLVRQATGNAPTPPED